MTYSPRPKKIPKPQTSPPQPMNNGSSTTQRAGSQTSKKKMHDVYVVRHGERVNMSSAGGARWYSKPRFQFEPIRLGNRTLCPRDMDFNPPMTSDGILEARSAGACLAEINKKQPIRYIFASPGFRCQQTAQEIAVQLGLTFTVVSALYEFLGGSSYLTKAAEERFGKNQMCNWLSPAELHALGYSVDTQTKDDTAPTLRASEREATFQRRFRGTVEYLVNTYAPLGGVIFVCHRISHIMVKCLLCDPHLSERRYGMRELRHMKGFKPNPCAISHFKHNERGGKWEVEMLGSDAHIPEHLRLKPSSSDDDDSSSDTSDSDSDSDDSGTDSSEHVIHRPRVVAEPSETQDTTEADTTEADSEANTTDVETTDADTTVDASDAPVTDMTSDTSM